MHTTKASGASCPNCDDPFPSEYAQLNQPARWTCHACGASGELTGSLSIRRAAAPAPAAPKREAPPWARNLTRA